MKAVGKVRGKIGGASGELATDPVRIALSYPFEWPETECVLLGDRLMRLVRFEPDEPLASIAADDQGEDVGWVADHLRKVGGPLVKTAGFQTILASGSNASPSRMFAKFQRLAEHPPVFFLPGSIADHVTVYSCHFASYGSMPATLTHRPGARTQLIAIVVPTMTLDALHASEALGQNYGYFRQSEIPFSASTGHTLQRPHTYLSLRGMFAPAQTPRRLAAVKTQGCDWPSLTQRQALSRAATLLGQGGTSEAFVRDLLANDQKRERQTAQLARIARQETIAEGWERLA